MWKTIFDKILSFICAYVLAVVVTFLICGAYKAIEDNTKPVSAKRIIYFAILCAFVAAFIIYLD